MFNILKFKAALALSGKTMKDLAAYLKMNQSTLYRKTNGSTEFTRKEIQEICEFLNLESPTEIFFDNEIA